MKKPAIIEKLSTERSKWWLRKILTIACFVLVIFTAVYFTFLYPELGLILLVALIAITNEIDDFIKKLLWPNSKKIIMIVLAISVGAGSFSNYFANIQNMKFLAGTCDLQTATSKQSWNLNFGTIGGTATTSTPQNDLIGNDPLSLSIVNGHLNIQATVRDNQGNILGYVNGSTFHTQAPGVEFNCDSKDIEVRDTKGNTVFQLEISTSTVDIYGVLFYGTNEALCATPNGDINNPEQCSLTPIFKYPADEFQGVRA